MSEADRAFAAFDLCGKTAIVTGGAGGIGLACAKGLALAGAAVAILDRQENAATDAAETLVAQNLRAIAIPADVTDEPSVEAAIAKVADEIGGPDILIASAGIAIRGATIDLQLTDWKKVVDVNMTGAFLCARYAAKRMIGRGGGAIVNIASVMGLSGGGVYPNVSYQSTKGALVNMTRALAVEWAPHNIRVNAVAPTWVNTPLIAGLLAQPDLMEKIYAMTPMGKLAEPDDVANAVVYLASSAAAMVTGHTLPIDGGFLAQ